MPNLGDYLGQLLAEITLARMHADLETVRLAEFYSSHPLLRHLPVPHVRLPEVDLDLPVVIKEAEVPAPGESPRGGLKLDDLRRRFDELLTTHLQRAEIKLSAAERSRLSEVLDARAASAAGPTEFGVDVHRIADDLTSAALGVVGQVRAGSREATLATTGALADELRAAARLELLKARTPPPRLVTLVTGAELREAGPAELHTRLRLKITEQGLEWTTIEAEGQSHERLVPE